MLTFGVHLFIEQRRFLPLVEQQGLGVSLPKCTVLNVTY